MGRALVDISKQRFGKLVVIEYDHSYNGNTYWKCKCDCGNTCVVKKDSLKYGNTKSCGCLRAGKNLLDLSGQRFGKLTVLERADFDKKNKQYFWKCKCDCGNIVYVRGNNLRSGSSASCGCTRIKDLSEQRFGRLVAKKYMGNNPKNRTSMWLCKCDCGNTKIVDRNCLISGSTKSCGCLKKKIKYENEYHIKNK